MNNPDKPTEERDDKINALMILKNKVQKDSVKFKEGIDLGWSKYLTRRDLSSKINSSNIFGRYFSTHICFSNSFNFLSLSLIVTVI